MFGAHIEVDPATLEDLNDETYASSGYDTSNASMTSYMNEYVLENGVFPLAWDLAL